MRVFVAITTLVVAAAGCAEPLVRQTGERELIGGQVVTGTDPAVVALLNSEGGVCCTGTLISPTVVLTAAHCLDPSLCGTAEELTVHFGDDVNEPGSMRMGVREAKEHEQWAGALGNGRDIALLLLNFSVDPTLPVPLNTAAVEPMVGGPYRIVGFGIKDRVTRENDGKKRDATVTITNALNDPPADEILINDNAAVICFGDSGGPGFVTINDTEYVAGVHSWTSGNCFGPNGDTRVDLYVDSFIRPWVEQNDPACGADGLCARIGCRADPDCLPCGPDGTCTSECALPDPDCPTSAIGEICQADTQCLDGGVCVLWHADPSTKFCSRPCDTANDDCPAPMSCQNVDPFGDVCSFAGGAEPPGVLGSDCQQATDCGSYLCQEGRCVTVCDLDIGKGCPAGFECRDQACHIEGSGGGSDDDCLSITARGDGGALVLLALACLIATRPRRRR